MFKVEYKIVNKYDLSNNAGYHLIIDSEYEYMEYYILNNKNKIIKRKEFILSDYIKDLINKILIKHKEIFCLNSFIYLEGINKHKEQTFIFELNELNRKIEGYNIVENHILVTVFNEIKEALKEILTIHLY